MSIKGIKFLVLIVSLLCTFSLPNVQGCGGSSGREGSASSPTTPSPKYKWQGRRTINTSYVGWNTSFDNEFSRECRKKGESLWNIQSVHENYHEDRVWDFSCRIDPNITSKCTWSPKPVNSFDGTVNHICPKNGHIIGMHGSAFDGDLRDREFKFKCCDDIALQNKSCQWTSYANTWNGKMNFKVPSGYYLAGAYSYHHDFYEDRRWKFYVCQ